MSVPTLTSNLVICADELVDLFFLFFFFSFFDDGSWQSVMLTTSLPLSRRGLIPCRGGTHPSLRQRQRNHRIQIPSQTTTRNVTSIPEQDTQTLPTTKDKNRNGQRHIALKIAFSSTDAQHGFAPQRQQRGTISEILFESLIKCGLLGTGQDTSSHLSAPTQTHLLDQTTTRPRTNYSNGNEGEGIFDRLDLWNITKACGYSMGARTDKLVASAGTVVSLWVRDKRAGRDKNPSSPEETQGNRYSDSNWMVKEMIKYVGGCILTRMGVEACFTRHCVCFFMTAFDIRPNQLYRNRQERPFVGTKYKYLFYLSN
jgi:hypothetical protein